MTTLARNALAGGAGVLAQVTNAIHLVMQVGFIMSLSLFVYGRVIFAIGRHSKGD